MAASAFPAQSIPHSQSGPLAVAVAGGGCSNCFGGSLPITCEWSYVMPLGASIINNSDSSILVEVTTTISLPNPVYCNNASDTQIAQYLIPVGGEAQPDFSHYFAGAFSGALFSASAVVVQADDPALIGSAAQASISVGTSWRMCGNSRGKIKEPF